MNQNTIRITNLFFIFLVCQFISCTVYSPIGGPGTVAPPGTDPGWNNPSHQIIDFIGVNEAYRMLNHGAYYWLDLRSPNQYLYEGTIPNAMTGFEYQSLRELEGKLYRLNVNRNYVIYNEDGYSMASVLSVFRNLGFSNVLAISGGFRAWQSRNYPIEINYDFERTVITTEQAYRLGLNDNFVWLDLRPPTEVQSRGYIPMARTGFHFNNQLELMNKIDRLPRNQRYIFYNSTGQTLSGILQIFDNMGFRSVYGIQGGFNAWVNRGYPITGGIVVPEREYISVEEAYRIAYNNRNYVWLDLRTDAQISQSGKIPRAETGYAYSNIRDLEAKISRLDKNRTYIIYNADGRNLDNVLASFEKLKFTNVSGLQGGFNRWKERDYPISRDTPGSVQGMVSPEIAFRQNFNSNHVWLDLRTPAELKRSGIIKDARTGYHYNTNRELSTKIAKLDKNARYVIYNSSGAKLEDALVVFKNAGFRDVKGLEGGFVAWKNKNYPTTGTSEAATSDVVSVDVARNQAYGKGTVFLDLRAVDIHSQTGTITNAKTGYHYSTIRDLTTKIGRLNKSSAYIIYNADGKGIEEAVKAFKSAGIMNVRGLAGGFAAWKAKNYPITAPPNQNLRPNPETQRPNPRNTRGNQ
ncbi:rhodanese-like domain-containing protein [Pararhodonellum marinum]|uniref:rhodanese-like domain-containing protein n=1 Tax=Pararhodonellum marinum TaxID=2755358 RepID=UPI00188E61FB|nr:rhodanese-like domain-containing protein [Pararhodonellum marinum]